MKQTRISVLMALTICSFLVPWEAVAHPPYHPEVGRPNVSVEFLVAGRPLPVSPDRGGGGFVGVPRWGVEYEIRVTNHERHDRVLFVIGVDGLSIMDGSDVSKGSSGYVLEPGGSGRIRGWRRGLDHVAAFTFTGREDSYAGQTGRRGDIGQAWVWAIREKSSRPMPKKRVSVPAEAKSERAGSRALHADGETGTGYGDELEDRVRTTRFMRSDSVSRLNFRYGLHRPVMPYYRGGDDRGVSDGDFATPPPGWNRRK